IHLHGGTLSFDAHLPWRSPLHRLGAGRAPWIYSNHFWSALKTGPFPPEDPAYPKAVEWMMALVFVACLGPVCPAQIFDSRENERRIARYFPWAKQKFTTIYHSGLEGLPPKPEFRHPVITIGNLGHIGQRKGQQDLLEAFCLLLPRFPKLELVL